MEERLSRVIMHEENCDYRRWPHRDLHPFSLLKYQQPLAVTVYEQARQAGVGMPYSDEENSRMMLANIASIEIPPILCTYIDWLKQQSKEHLARYGVSDDSLHVRQFLPRILLGEYFRDQFIGLAARAKQQGFPLTVHESCEVTDLQATAEGVRVWAQGEPAAERFDLAVIATGHVWPVDEESTRTFFPARGRPDGGRDPGVQGRDHGHLVERY